MVLTLRAVLDELDRLVAATASARSTRSAATRSSSRSRARRCSGARGNSGVILSQLIRGAAEELVSRPGELIDATLIGAALARAADRAYASVREPAEGTILTVVREMAHQIVTDVAHSPENRASARRPSRASRTRDRGGARARGRRRAGLGQAQAGAARGAARRGRRRRRRLRADDHLRRHRRGAARRRAAGARPPRAGADHPPAAQLGHLPLLHELRGHRRRPQPGSLHRAARGARRLGARRRRREAR